MIQDIAPGALPSSPAEFTASGPNVYFVANDGTTGFELWALPRTALLSTFADVPASHGSWSFVEALAASGLTGGCGQDNYCPDLLLKRAESAVFLVKRLPWRGLRAASGDGHGVQRHPGQLLGGSLDRTASR